MSRRQSRRPVDGQAATDDLAAPGAAGLGPAHAHALSETLQARYQARQPYTRVGAHVLLATNPVRPVERNADSVSQQYLQLAQSGSVQDAMGIAGAAVAPNGTSLPPSSEPLAAPAHVFDLAYTVFSHMLRLQEDQSVMFSGYAGSGKSETRKLFVQQLCGLSRGHKKKSKILSGVNKLETLLEAFGNAATIDSPNASRYGRYMEYQYNDHGKMVGTKILDYLFEKSRVVELPNDERNFNIFYYLLAGADASEKSQWKLQEPRHFHYLQGSKASKIELTDAEAMAQLRDHMKSCGIGRKQQAAIFQLVAAILHLGNIHFMANAGAHANEACKVKNPDDLVFVAELLGVSPENLEYALTYQTKLVERELCTVFLDADDAVAQRDSLAKTLHALVFQWVIEHLNQRFCQDECATFIGVVDFPGFQSHQHNRFESFLWNFAAEQMESQRRGRLLRELPEDALYEGIGRGQQLPYEIKAELEGPVATLDLIRRGDNAIINLLDSQSFRAESTATAATTARNGLKPNASRDAQLQERLMAALSRHPRFSTPMKANAKTFGIVHFGGPVHYDTDGFTAKNTDILSPDFVSIFRGNGNDIRPSDNPFARALFSEKIISTQKDPRAGGIVAAAQTNKRPVRQPSMSLQRRQSMKRRVGEKPTVAYNFAHAVTEMCETLQETVAWYVVCLKPNERLRDTQFDVAFVAQQLTAYAVPTLVDTLRVTGDYAMSTLIGDFAQAYAPLLSGEGAVATVRTADPAAKQVQDLVAYFHLTQAATDDPAAPAPMVAMGANKIFLREPAWQLLDRHATYVTQLGAQHGGDQGAGYDPAGAMASARAVLAAQNAPGYPDDDEMSTFEGSDAGFVHGFAAGDEFGGDAGGAGSGTPGSDGIRMRVLNKDVEAGKRGSTLVAQSGTDGADGAAGEDLVKGAPERTPAPRASKGRRRWVCCTWFLTWWVPDPCLTSCGGMRRKDVRMAWREKLALCMLILIACGCLLFFIVGLGRIICPKKQVLSSFEVASKNDPKNPYAYMYGRYYDIKELASAHESLYNVQSYEISSWFGKDVSPLFYKQNMFQNYCPGIASPPADWDNILNRPTPNRVNFAHNQTTLDGDYLLFVEYMRRFIKGRVVWQRKYIKSNGNGDKKLLILFDNVYDVSTYFNAANNFLDPNGDAYVMQLFQHFAGEDGTKYWNQFIKPNAPNEGKDILRCMNEMFYIGQVDARDNAVCKFSNYILLATSIVIVLVIGVKFLAALQFGSRREPEEHDKFIIIQVPCYTEGPDSLTRSLESLALLRYDDKRKLLFIICDGMIIGSGNDRPTPRIVLDILGVDPDYDPKPCSFQSLGEGDQQHNMAKVYSGLFEVQGHSVPYLVVVKVGKPSERSRPGNRGKRDSQMVLMRFLNRVHFNNAMNPLELEIYHHMKNVIGVNPSFYEYILMVDADTQVTPDSLNRLVSTMIHDSKIMGLCGETMLSNEKDTWVSMVQVFEYYISQNCAKAFESLFSTVTCLPGCFSIYRVRTPTKNVPLLISNAIIDDYGVNVVDTLHLKNLLHLGEDRYLTTLLLKHFPNYKTKFTPDACCHTYAPDQWAVLVSQRRRWINSTVHNLLELVWLPQLCGFCCFSMRFVVLLDLTSTMVQPASIAYIGYLIYAIASDTSVFPLISVVMLALIYGLQAILFILKRQWAQIGWMFIYILALPVTGLYLPLYAFWHFDDFSWGNTRVVVGEDGKKKAYAPDLKPFDPSEIPLRKWADNAAPSAQMQNMSLGMGMGMDQFDTKSAISGYTGMGGVPPTAMQHRQSMAFGTSMVGGGYAASAFGGSQVMGPGAVASPGSVYGGGPAVGYAGSQVGGMPVGYAGSQIGGPAAAMPAGMHQPPAYPYDPQNHRQSFMSSPGFVVPGVTPMGMGMGMVPQSPQQPAMAMTPGAGGVPTDDQLLAEVRRILATANLVTLTKKGVRDQLSQLFGCDLNTRKASINRMVDGVLSGEL